MNEEFKKSCCNGDLEYVLTYIDDVDPDNSYLLEACFEGHKEISEILIRKKKSVPYDDCLRISCHYNHVEIMDNLIKWYIDNNRIEELEKVLNEFNIVLDK